ncbi:relaxase/mobilization nuclease domain-containing protein (plasmid) [Xylella taiwanensis]|uniref:Relaxase/mobilization nuclease domain-containing protein n=1 Tax=Xylella taiwanensis TaxID=1444770 RepID=A0ABS8TVN5_9GAMM|nr:relaxase/mobilization nuclease domain-containing protein [Xylella taiwanensis]MCD8459801.1 relaxase/mobilization nuclease domain-containing protein [Xylella taiwanensis]MCD8474191.1 relaxase/mobilization nuclease domain-containing protein [Xylella taiwanensis]UFN08030.1 relaxase/mobilization nuclease domain-containing protein [Xylella taiwanensis]UFN10323.1 relaxase/mobilization nuclease domain-containing protein [Xylella taiwanensis]UFN12611.1 relaxase/mobilization nuclease domain-containi
MSAFDPLDGWFEKGFRVRVQKSARTAKRDQARARSGTSLSSTSGLKFSANAKAKNTVSVIRKAPEVMVKITGSSSGLNTVKHHLDYISRNGQIELTNESGETIQGRDELKALREQMKASQVPNESNKREYLHVLFSMPPGTPEKAMREAVMQFCQEEFANRRYVAALHDDTDHTHVHVCVSTRDIDRADEPRLSPRKADLFRWRQGFADKLRENGIDAAASERRHRFNHRKPEHPVVRQIRAENPKSDVYNERRAKEKALDRAMKAIKRPETASVGPLRPPRVPKVYEALKSELQAALKAGVRPINPAEAKISETKAQTLASWGQVAKNLESTEQTDLAKSVTAFIRDADKSTSSRTQELFDLAKARGKSKDIGQEL